MKHLLKLLMFTLAFTAKYSHTQNLKKSITKQKRAPKPTIEEQLNNLKTKTEQSDKPTIEEQLKTLQNKIGIEEETQTIKKSTEKTTPEQWVQSLERTLELFTREEPITYKSGSSSVDDMFNKSNNTIDINVDLDEDDKKLTITQIRQGIDNFINTIIKEINEANDPNIKTYLKSTQFHDHQKKLNNSKNDRDYPKILFIKLDQAYTWLNNNKDANPSQFATSINKLQKLSKEYFNYTPKE